MNHADRIAALRYAHVVSMRYERGECDVPKTHELAKALIASEADIAAAQARIAELEAQAKADADAEDAARYLRALKSARPWVALLLEETKVQLYKQNCLQSLQEIDAAIKMARERGNG